VDDDTYYGDYTFEYVDNGGVYYDTYCECEMTYAYLEKYGNPDYYIAPEGPYENSYVTPSGEQVYFGFYGTYVPSYSHRNDFDWSRWDYNAAVDYSKPFTETIAKNNFVDLT
jgi:hypothetical protein